MGRLLGRGGSWKRVGGWRFGLGARVIGGFGGLR